MTCTAADTSTASNEFVMVRYNIEAQDLQSLGYGTASAKSSSGCMSDNAPGESDAYLRNLMQA